MRVFMLVIKLRPGLELGPLCKLDRMGPQETTFLDFYSFNKLSSLQLLLAPTIMQETRLEPVCSLC
jgi:hypothetical protein